MEELLSPRKRLFLAFAREHNCERAEKVAVADRAVSREFDVPGMFSRVREHRNLDADGLIASLRESSASTAELSHYLLWYMYHNQTLSSPSLAALKRFSSEVFLERTPEHSLIAFFEAISCFRAGRFMHSLTHLLVGMGRLDENSGDPERDFYLVLFNMHAAKALTRFRTFDLAEEMLARAAELAANWRFVVWLRVLQQLGTFHWSRGDAEQALSLHRDHGARRHAERMEYWDWLVRSHIAATKCAIDLEDQATAVEEIASAKSLQKSHGELPAADRGYLYLYESQLQRMQGRRSESTKLLTRALEIFSQETSFPMGLKDSVRQLCEFAHEDSDLGELERGLEAVRELQELYPDELFGHEFHELIRAIKSDAAPDVAKVLSRFSP